MLIPRALKDATHFPWHEDADLSGLIPEDFDLISVDVFDTLVLRIDGEASGLYARLETVGREQGALKEALPQHGFARLRAQMESEARDARQASAGHREVGLDDIYRRLPRHLGDPEAMAALEVAVEGGTLIANPFMLDLLRDCRARQRRVWLVSDTTYDEATLAGLLAGCGITPDLYDRLVVSCAHACSKADGRLFDLVRAEAGMEVQTRWVHIGDNPVSDVAVPRGRGVQAIHYRVPERLQRIEQRESLIGSGAPSPLQAYRRLTARTPAPAGHGVAGDGTALWFDLGRYVIGPAVHAFCTSVVRSCMASGVRRIAPFMREGALFAEIIRRETQRIGFEADIRPLYISREALRLPLSPGLDGDTLVRQGSNNSTMTLGDALRPFALEESLPPALATLCGRRLADLFAEPGSVDLITAFLERAETRAQVAEVIAKAREKAVAYLRRELANDDVVATVDLGARGTVQGQLGRLPGIGDQHVFHHHLLYAVPDLFRRMTDGHHWHVFAGLDEATLHRMSMIYRSPQLIELALIGNLPTTVSYCLDAGEPKPVLLPAAGGPEQARKLAACRHGILHTCSVLNELAQEQRAVADARIPPQDALNALFRLIQAPFREEVKEAADLLYDLNDGTRSTQPLADGQAVTALGMLDRLHPTARPKLAVSLRPSILPWPQAALTLQDESAMVRICEASKFDLQHNTYIRLLLELMKAEGLSQAILCAAGGLGGMGPAFLDMAPLAEVSVAGYFDYFRDSTTPSFPGIPTLDVEDLARQPCSDFVIVSMGYANALASIIERTLKAAGRCHRIIMLPIHTQ
jgi:hypothetical protein